MKQPNGSQNYKASFGVQLLTAGTSACIADLMTFPLDTAKVRLQLQGEGQVRIVPTPAVAAVTPAGTITIAPPTTVAAPALKYRGLAGTILTISRQEGPLALYNGLSAGLQRQMCFASVRLGFYDGFKGAYSHIFNERPESLQLFTRVFAGLTTGGLCVVFAQPTDVVKIRMQAQVKGGPGAFYRSTLQAYRTIGQQEGMNGLWKGAWPNIVRNAIVNVAEIVCYDVVKECLLRYMAMNDDIRCHFSAAVVAGFCATVCASPVDVVKTRYMNSKKGQYKGALDVTIRMFKAEGLPAFYKGFVPSFTRIVTWNIALWITYEQAKRLIFTKVEEK